MKDGEARSICTVYPLLQNEIQSNEQYGSEDYAEVGAELRVAENDRGAFDPCAIVEGETTACEKHKEGSPQFKWEIVKVHRAVVVGRKAARSNCRHCVRDGNAELDAAEHEDDGCNCCKDKVNLKECHGHIAQTRHDAVHRRPRALGVVHIDRACAGLRQERDEDDDDAEPPNPRCHHPPEENAVGEMSE